MNFGHHPDPANDFCIEVEEITAIWRDRCIGFPNRDDHYLEPRLVRALAFCVGGDEIAVRAKDGLREIAGEYSRANNLAKANSND